MANARHAIDPVCGGCGSSRLLLVNNMECQYAACEDCGRLQETETRLDPATQLCDNCAFRPGSPERADPWGWMRKEEAFEGGQPFYCHKGMKVELVQGSLVYIPGDDPSTLKPCAGWIAWTKAHPIDGHHPRVVQ